MNILVNNAGASVFPEPPLNRDKINMNIAANYFGHFYLTSQLWPVLKNADNLRIVNVDLQLAFLVPIVNKVDLAKFEFKDLAGKKDDQWQRRYFSSKVANLLFIQELAKRVAKHNPQARVVSARNPEIFRTTINPK